MASSSNSKRPFCSASSSNSKWRYDVFLSFRGEDTRKNFTSHLHKALDHANIETFIDDEGLRKGEEISLKLLEAIEGSRIALIVFSKTYAHSKWCLDELVKIMKCQEENGQEVFPIFYDVEPSEVRNPTGIYGEECKSHESNANEEKKKKIEEWRTALRKAGNLSGFHLKDDRSEAEFIEEIIGQIRRLIPKWVHVGENIVGMDEKLKEVKLLIDAQSNKVSVVGIYGTGGIGKTTIAKFVYNDMLDQFKRHSFLENVREKSKDDRGLLELQKKLLCDILMKKDLELSNIGEGIETIKSKCCFEKVLIVLDDVVCDRQLEFLAPNFDCFHQGSIIIVTTRDKRCLDVYESYSSYEPKVLAREQAKELFCWKAFKQDHPIENFVDLSNRILDYADGLPLALVVLGALLCKRNVVQWKNTLHKLKKSPPNGIQEVLQISYNDLDDEYKKMFLDIACFFKDEDEKFVTRILEGCKFPLIGLTVLDERCLISITNDIIRMHDLLQEMGWTIVRQIDRGRPGKWSRLWEYEDIETVFTQNKGTKNIEGILINQSCGIGKCIQLTAEAFKKMNQLRLLIIVEFGVMVGLSQDFELPCHDLVYFRWDYYPLESLPSNFHADNLVELNLRFSKIKHFWEGNMPAKKLKVIDLSYSVHLVDISSISSMPNLETLILQDCFGLKSLPRNLHMLERLQTLSCFGCSNLESFPEIEEEMRSLRKLDLCYTGITELPSSIRHLNGLEDLDLSCCKNLSTLPEIKEEMRSLRKLNLGNSGITELPSSIRHLNGLEDLDLSDCNNLSTLPDSISSLSSLQALNLDMCLNFESFPEIKEEMRSLRKLNLRGTGITELPSSIRHLNGLEDLDLSYCENLSTLPDSISSLSSLKTLRINDCPRVKEMLEINLWVYSSPWYLSPLTCHISNSAIIWYSGVHNCFSSLEALDPRCPLSSSLEELSVRKFYGMEEDILSGSFHLSSLEILSLGSCPRVVEGILDDIFHLSSLEELSRTKCKPTEEGIPSDILNLSSLQQLSLRDCNLMEGKILNHICHLTSLEELYLGWNHFSSIPAGISRLSNLKALDLSHCKNLQQIPELPSSLRFLGAHCSDGISSSEAIHSMVNCFKSRIEELDAAFVPESKLINSCYSFSGNGISIVIPRSSGILEWLQNMGRHEVTIEGPYQNMERHEVTIELPRNWYKNDDLWGFALYCVFVASAYEKGMLTCALTIERNHHFQSYDFDLYCRCVPCDVSDMQWVIYYPKLAIEKCHHTNQCRHCEVSFCYFTWEVKVKECGIRLVYREDYEQKHPIMAQGSTSHGNFGEHGSVREDTNSEAHNKRNPTEQSPGD